MTSPPKVFISHTTRDPRDVALARRLADDLTARGATVWIAPTSIPTGSEWEAAIVVGIMEQCSHFLVILSAASTRAEWVLEEIRIAQERRKRDPSFVILPLTIGNVEDYPGRVELARLQHLLYVDDPAVQAAAVASALRLPPGLPARFASLVRERTAGFVGREHVFSRIDEFLESQDRGYFVIEGDPGVGKSAVLAELVRRTDCIAHFNVGTAGIDSAADFIESVCTQVISRYGLDHPVLPPNATRNGAFLTQVLEEASDRLAVGERLLIVVDALDEVQPSDIGTGTGANILFLPSSLPRATYFVVSRRPVRISLVVSAPMDILDLMSFPAENRLDVLRFLREAMRRESLRRWFNAAVTTDGTQVTEDDFLATLADKSAGNFMYLRHVVADLERGLYRDVSLSQLPIGLEGYYEDHWRRMGMQARPLPRTRIKIIYVLAEVRQPISRDLLASLSSEDPVTVQEVLDEWDQFLHEDRSATATRYNLYHATFREFLHRKDIVQAIGMSIQSVHATIAASMTDELFGNSPPAEPTTSRDSV